MEDDLDRRSRKRIGRQPSSWIVCHFATKSSRGQSLRYFTTCQIKGNHGKHSPTGELMPTELNGQEGIHLFPFHNPNHHVASVFLRGRLFSIQRPPRSLHQFRGHIDCPLLEDHPIPQGPPAIGVVAVNIFPTRVRSLPHAFLPQSPMRAKYKRPLLWREQRSKSSRSLKLIFFLK